MKRHRAGGAIRLATDSGRPEIGWGCVARRGRADPPVQFTWCYRPSSWPVGDAVDADVDYSVLQKVYAAECGHRPDKAPPCASTARPKQSPARPIRTHLEQLRGAADPDMRMSVPNDPSEQGV